jgi:hypothetical protein
LSCKSHPRLQIDCLNKRQFLEHAGRRNVPVRQRKRPHHGCGKHRRQMARILYLFEAP